MKVIIIIPTFNERENVGVLLDALEREFEALKHEMNVLVVDDSSPDGTADLVIARQQTTPWLHLNTGQKAGLGAAYIRGMDHAINTLGADVIFEMDADLSHKPEDVPRLLAAIEEGADFVIGSRYVVGGSIPHQWSLGRRLNSRVGNIVARYVAGIQQVRDCTAGFRAIRASVLRRIDMSGLRVRGYAFQVALLHRAVSVGAKVKEIPVDFVDRTIGESKLGLDDILEFVVNAWWIRFQNSKLFIKFCIVGASGTVVNLGAFSVLLWAGVHKLIASPIAIEISIISNFLLNNYWTFRSRDIQDRVRIRGLKFNVVSIISLIVSYSTFVILSTLFPSVPPQIPQFAGILPATVVNYFLNAYWTFKPAASANQDDAISPEKLGLS